MPHVLLRMVRSGHFYPAGNWVIPTQGRGMVRKRAEACWRMLTDPQHTSMADVDAMFFMDVRYRHFEGAIPQDPTPPVPAELGESVQHDVPVVPVGSPSVACVFALADEREARRVTAEAEGRTGVEEPCSSRRSLYHVLGIAMQDSMV